MKKIKLKKVKQTADSAAVNQEMDQEPQAADEKKLLEINEKLKSESATLGFETPTQKTLDLDAFQSSSLDAVKKSVDSTIASFYKKVDLWTKNLEEETAAVLTKTDQQTQDLMAQAKEKIAQIQRDNNALIQARMRDLDLREDVVAERESRMDKAQLARDLEARIITQKAELDNLLLRIGGLKKQQDAILEEAKRAASQMLSAAKKDYDSYVAAFDKMVADREKLKAKQEQLLNEQRKAEWDALEKEIEKKRERANKEIDEAKKKREGEIAEAEKRLEASKQEIKDREKKVEKERQTLAQIEGELNGIDNYRKRLTALEQEYQEQQRIYDDLTAESERLRVEGLAQRKQAIQAEVSTWEKSEREIYQAELEELKKTNQALRESNAALESKEAELVRREEKAKNEEYHLSLLSELLDQKRSNLDDDVKKRIQELLDAKDKEIADTKENLSRVCNEKNELYSTNTRLNSKFKSGDYSNNDFLNAENERLKNELKENNSKHKLELADLQAKADNYDSLHDELIQTKEELEKLRLRNDVLRGAENRAECSESEASLWRGKFAEALDELNRTREPSKEQRLAPIKRQLPNVSEFIDLDCYEGGDEWAWLDGIEKKCKDSGIIFSRRILNAYHTAMKIHDWSPLTVLAGVSGTGKSELPRQYATHGGMYFVSIAVKPDWDSPASLFGYYNSIENKFQPTELLRTLYQAQQDADGSLKDCMVMVLLDEMNLAHVELYFADLLSKFEYVRGTDNDVQYEIDLGASCEPEILTIGKNILWTGTMNEDETTKAISDKVVDRSTLISFPRPHRLYDRLKAKNAPQEYYLPAEQWKRWVEDCLTMSDLEQKLVKYIVDHFLYIVTDINEAMGSMGRNLGHRVWQSITNYMLNHPTVIRSAKSGNNDKLRQQLDMAFSEAVAFKIMPKLRGVETNGIYEEYLLVIGKIINKEIPELAKDFEKACKLPTGLFQWCSADFLMEKEEQ